MCDTPFKPVCNQQYCGDCQPRAYRRKPKNYQQHKGDECERCQFTPKHTCQLDVHHRDGDPFNNDPANLETLCANCHRLDTLGPRKQAA